MTSRIYRFRSPAKINLFLKIKNKRADGFHNLETVFERISLCDDIHISLNDSGKITLWSNKRIPLKLNLVFKAASLIKDKFQIKKGMHIKLIKKNSYWVWFRGCIE